MRWAIALVALTGCSQLFGLDTPVRDDASVGDADMSVDTPASDAIQTNACTAKWQAGSVVLSMPTMLGVSESGIDEQSPFVTLDGLDLYYARNGEVFRATRSVLTADFANRQKQTLSSGATEGKTFVSPNKLRALFSSARTGGSGSYDIWRGSRPSPGSGWVTDELYLGNVNTAAGELDPHLTDDLLHLYIAGVPSSAASQQIMFSTRATVNDVFSAPAAILELNSNTGESGPTLTADELVIVYSSNQIVSNGPGASNLWYATRAKTSDPFGLPNLVPTVNSDSFDITPHISEDGCTLYFASARATGYDLYRSTVQ